jgi:hypothetical protein
LDNESSFFDNVITNFPDMMAVAPQVLCFGCPADVEEDNGDYTKYEDSVDDKAEEILSSSYSDGKVKDLKVSTNRDITQRSEISGNSHSNLSSCHSILTDESDGAKEKKESTEILIELNKLLPFSNQITSMNMDKAVDEVISNDVNYHLDPIPGLSDHPTLQFDRYVYICICIYI